MRQGNPHRLLPKTLQWRLGLARGVLWAERLTLALWPCAALAAFAMSLALLGVPSILPRWLCAGLLLAFLAAFAVVCVRGWAATRAPRTQDAERRLERDTGLRHRPFAVLRDRPAGGGAAELALWQAHCARAGAALAGVRLRGPDPLLASRDAFALRAAAALLLIASLVIAGPQAGNRLAALFAPGFSTWRGAPAPVIQAWIQPPAYTGLPPIFLPPAGGGAPVEVPQNSKLTISITGIGARPSLTMAGTSKTMESLGADSFQAGFPLALSGRLSVGTFWSGLASWDLSVLPNEPPAVAWAALPGRAGASASTKLPWRVGQRWGVAGLQAELRPKDRPDLPALTVPLPLPGTPKQAAGAGTADLSANPYAGVMMTGRLVARDVSGQTGTSEPADFILPARAFHHPLARALAELRRRLALHPGTEADEAADLAALAEAPFGPHDPSGLSASGVTLNLAAAGALLNSMPHPSAATVAEAQARLWVLALALDGALPDAAARALAEARERLREGLEDRRLGKLSQRELADRLDALREALDKRLAEIGKQAMQRGAIEKFDPRSQHLSSNALDRMIRKMEQASREGRMEDARREMAELEKMLDQLKNAHIESRGEMQQRQEQARRGRQMLGAVQDLVRRETTLLDHAQARAPAPPPPGLPPQFHSFTFPPPPQGDTDPRDAPPLDEMPQLRGDVQPEPPQEGEGPQDAAPPDPGSAQGHSTQNGAARGQTEDARTQRALHRALDALSQSFAESGGQKPRNLDDAGHAMDDAAQALAQHQDPLARDGIGRAIAALQQGGQNMARQMQQQGSGQMQLTLQPGGQDGGGQDGEDDPEDGQGGRKKDPFGRQVDGNGTVADDPKLRVPDEMEQGRSRAIQDELRRRGADRQRPQEELNYIDRLLKPF